MTWLKIHVYGESSRANNGSRPAAEFLYARIKEKEIKVHLMLFRDCPVVFWAKGSFDYNNAISTVKNYGSFFDEYAEAVQNLHYP